MALLGPLFDQSDFMPHGMCFVWRPDILALHVGSDALIAVAYFAIPGFLFVLSRRRDDLMPRWALQLFCAFILLCGLTHLAAIWVIWTPDYVVEGFIKLATGLVSVTTAVLVWIALKDILSLPSRHDLERLNASLREEIEERGRTEQSLRRTQEELRHVNAGLEERVRARTLAIEQSNAELEQFASIASHDLQEPLRMVSGFCGLLKSKYADRLDVEGKEFIDFAVGGANRMQAMIDDILAYARVGRRGQEAVSVDLGAVVRKVTESLRGAIDEFGAVVDVRPLPTVPGREGQLEQLFQNLVANALKYRGDRRPEIHIDAERDGATWRITVADNGIGFDPAAADQIFEMFRRLHAEDEYPGTGIGLAICRKIAEGHDGRIWAESEVGIGSRFHVVLPSVNSG